MVELEQYQIYGRTAREIAASAEGEIRDGRLSAGDALPTVRALAARLRVSPATVNAAYRILRQRGLVVAAGRRGTRVAPRPAMRWSAGAGDAAALTPAGAGDAAACTPAGAGDAAALTPAGAGDAAALTPAGAGDAAALTPARAADPDTRTPRNADERSGRAPAAESRASAVRDLAVGLPDPRLLPELSLALARLDIDRKLRFSDLESADPDLLAVAAGQFAADGIRPGATAVVSGAFDGIERVLQAHLRAGDRVIVEDPTYIGIRDQLLALGLVEVPVPVDDRGLLPEPLAEALARGAEAAVIAPRAQNPLGAALDPERAEELRARLDRHPDVLIVEDDHAWAVTGAAYVSVIDPARPSWAVIRSMSKVLHPDLRLALLAGDETTVARVEGRQALGPRWVSHMLQALVADLLGDPGFEAGARRAADAYSARRAALIEALAEQGVPAYGRSGLNVWVPVHEEATVVRALLDHGWLVMAGERFRISSASGIRVTIATLEDEEAVEVARIIARVEHARRPRRAY